MRKNSFAKKLMVGLISASMLAGDVVPSYASFADTETLKNATDDVVFQNDYTAGDYVSDVEVADLTTAGGELFETPGTAPESSEIEKAETSQVPEASQAADGPQGLEESQVTDGPQSPEESQVTDGPQDLEAPQIADGTQVPEAPQVPDGTQIPEESQDPNEIQEPDTAEVPENPQEPDTIPDNENFFDGFYDGEAPLENTDGEGIQQEAEVYDDFTSGENTGDIMLMAMGEVMLMSVGEAAEGSLQAEINMAADGTPTAISLDQDYAENITIPDNKIIELNLNGHTLSSVRQEGDTGVLTGVTVYGDLTVKGEGSITANGVTNIRGIVVASGGKLTLESGTVSGYQIEDGSGAGILVSASGSLVMSGGAVSGNRAADYGGGIFAYNAKSLSLNGGTVSGNTAEYGAGIGINNLPSDFTTLGAITIEGNTASQSGGGIYLGDGNMNFAYDRTVIRNNTAEAGHGGGVFYAGKANVEIGSAEITGNTAGIDGGGVYFAAAVTAVLDGMTVSGNTTGRYGGGLFFQQGSNITVNAGSISENAAGFSGGGFMIYSANNTASTVLINDGNIDGNRLTSNNISRYGAGFDVYSNTAITMKGGSVSNNTGASHGGGIFQNGGTFTLEGGRISDNTAYSINEALGLGIYTAGNFTMSGGEISGNSCENGASSGGGVLCTKTAVLSGGVICNNTVTGVGGGLRMWASSNLTIEGDIVIENNTAGDRGGGVFNYWDLNQNNVTTIKGGVVRNNKATNYGGIITRFLNMEGGEISGNTATGETGGVLCRSANMTGGAITGNTAGTDYGGIRAVDSFTMTGGEISGNTAGGNGGGLGINGGGTVSTISGGRIADNIAGANYASTATNSGRGGGIYLYYGNASSTIGCTLNIEGDAEISGNRANQGGGILAFCNSNIILGGGTITGNTASIGGGGICVERYSNSLTVNGGAVFGNDSAQYGHDICAYNYNAQEGNPVVYYKRPDLILCPAVQMAVEGIWHDERKNQDIASAETIDNTASNDELESSGDRKTGFTEGYTFKVQKKVAQVGSIIYGSVQEAVDAIASAGQEEEILLLEDTIECVTIPDGVTAILDLSGHTVKGAGGSVITVEADADLTIRDTSEEQSGKIRGGVGNVTDEANGYRAGGGLFIEGMVTIESGSICENMVNRLGGGIYIQGNGSCVMTGGSISENRTSYWAGGVYVTEEGSFTLEGGEISGNNLTALWVNGPKAVINIEGGRITGNTSSWGGGIYVRSGGTVNITGGEITENSSSGQGGGLFMESGTVNMSDGEIAGNTAAGNGGGFYMAGGNANMSGGTVRDNSGANGGAVYVYGGKLHITGGEITGNRAVNDGGGIFYAAGGSAIELAAGGTVYANRADTGSANDIYLALNSKNVGIVKAADMGLEDYDCWLDAYGGTDIEDEITGTIVDKYYYLTASKKADPEVEVARIKGGDTYPSIQDAVNAAEEDAVIYLLKDCRESVSVSTGKAVTIDLNGYSLIPDRKYVFFVTGGGKLHLQNTYEENDKNEENAGILMPEEDAVNVRAAYVTNGGIFELGDGVTIQDFGGTINGGAIYAASGGKVRIQGGTIKNCKAANGGAVYITSNSSEAIELSMSGGEIIGCEASGEGGGIYFRTYDNGSKPTLEDVLNITGGVIDGCKAGSNGGGIRVYGKNHNDSCAEKIRISGVTVQNNTAGTAGGGAYIVCPGRDVKVELGAGDEDTIFQGNHAGAYAGLYIYGAKSRNERVTMTGVQIKDNRSNGNYGGVYIMYFSVAEIKNCTFSGNRTVNGGASRGALFIETEEYGDEVSLIQDTTFDNNYSYTSPIYLARGKYELNGVTVCNNNIYGCAGIECSGESGDYGRGNPTTVDLVGCSFYNNRSASTASSAGCGDYATMTIRGGTTLTGNSGTNCGTIYCSSGNATLIVENAEISGNTTTGNYGGGGIYCRAGQVWIKAGAVIRENTAPKGGGIYIWRNGRLTIEEGSLISGNHADYGAGIYMASEINSNSNYYMIPSLTMTGGEISGNTADISGGGIYVDGSFIGNRAEMEERNISNAISRATSLIVSGGRITGNSAGSYGGGVYTNYNGTLFQLVQGGQIYANKAGLGQDIYGGYSNNYVGSTYYRQNELQLVKASDMFADDPGKSGIGWLDEIKGDVITEAVKGKMIRAYALTLDYETDEVVAVIDGTTYTKVQDAVDAIEQGAYPGVEAPEIRIVKDVTESISIPAGVTAVLNLNGYEIQGINTALSVYGNLTVKDEPGDVTASDSTDYPKGTETGTITGNGVDAGGGIRVYSGGYVKMESGEISGCHAGERENTTANGGAGVCVDSGTFELAGGVICENTSRYGAAVLVRTAAGKFIMTGGEIRDNKAVGSGVIFNRGGSVEITGGTIENNEAATGTIYNSSGNMVITGTDESRPMIRGNKAATSGGAIYESGGTVTVGNADILNNRTTNTRTTDILNSAGGGIYVYGGTLNITDGTLISGNSAVRGGAIYNRSGSVKIIGGVITGNRAQMGGGIAQHPTVMSTVELMAGGVYGNTSTLSSAGNDFYSKYEGTGKYNPTGNNYPRLTMIPASKMGNSKYNVWRDDTYSGSSRTGMLLLEGEYVTGSITLANNVELTADYYDTETESDISSDYKVSKFNIGKYNTDTETYENGMTDGTAAFDGTAVKEQEITAKMLLDEGKAQEASETYMAEGEEKNYISYGGRLYEEDQAVSWAPGKDSGSANGVIRSYDVLTYSLAYMIEPKEEKEGDETGTSEKVHVWLEAELPLSTDEGEFAITANAFDEYTVILKAVDGKTVQVLRGYKEEEIVEKARSNFNVSIQLKGMKNGDTFKPVFRSWIEGNEENEADSPQAQSKVLTVSASGQYNVVLDHNTELSYTGYFDLSTGEETNEEEFNNQDKDNPHIVYGTMLGYGITVEMYKDGNNLKGFELPEGVLSFDISMKGSLFADGEAVEGGLSSAPYLWAYKENENTTYGRPLNSSANSFNMDWNDEDDKVKTTRYAYNAAPFNTGGNSYSCYNGGSWTIAGNQTTNGQAENTFRVTVNGYTINNDRYPDYASDTVSGRAFNSSSVKPFTAGYLQVIFPVTREQMEACNGKYMEVHMDAAVSDLSIKTVSGQTPESTDKGLETLELYFGDAAKDHAVNEMRYADNYINFETGMYVSLNPGGPGDNIVKENYFLKEDRSELSGTGGRGTTPLDSVVYIEGKANFSSMEYDTQNTTDLGHYINPDVFNPQTDNYKEYNYMTAINLLQKFDADAYTPVGAEAIVKAHPSKTNTGTNYFGNGAFYVATDETATEWSDTKTRDYELTVLYAAKPDGTNWEKKLPSANSDQDDGGVADMDSYREENLLYFTTLEELYSYFAERGIEGKCVGILYEFRNCCIRTGRYLSAQARMQVTSDFARTGGTYCTTNDVRAWTTYRPEYKLNYRNNKLDEVLYDFSWMDVSGSGSGPYGLGLQKDLGFYREFFSGDTASKYTVDENDQYKLQYEDGKPVTKTVTGTYPSGDGGETPYTAERTVTRMAAQVYFNGYIKSQYLKGNKVGSTHNGNRSGNTLLLYTLESGISIRTDDLIKGGSATSYKTVYSIDKGERIVKYEVEPSLTIASAVQDHELVSNGSQAADVHILLTFPDGLSYMDKSISFDYEGSDYQDGELQWTVGDVIENEDGSVSMEVSTVVTDINRKLPVINLSCEIGNPADNTKDLENGASLVTTAEIYATYEEHNNIAVDAHTATSTIQIVRTSNDGIYLDTGGDAILKDVGNDFQFVMHYYRGEQTPEGKTVKMANVLPYVGDGRGTEFTGGYRVKEITLEFNDVQTFDAFVHDNAGIIKWASGKNAQDNPIDSFSGSGEDLQYEVDKSDASAPYKVKVILPEDGLVQDAGTKSGIALYIEFLMTSVRGNSAVEVTVKLSPLKEGGTKAADMLKDGSGKTQAGGNVYADDFVFSDSTGKMQSSTIPVKVFNRRITGMVWMDMDHDGKYVAGSTTYISPDKRLAGINVNLYVLQETGEWIPATDTVGAGMPATETNASGFYAFDNLPAGTYRVEFTDPDGNYTESETILFERLSVTTLAEGSYISANRVIPEYHDEDQDTLDEDKANELATLKRAVLPEGVTIVLPSIDDGTGTSEYVTANWNAGFYYIQAELGKVWKNMRMPVTEGTSITLQLNGKTVLPDDPMTTVYNLDTDYVFTKTQDGVTVEKGTEEIEDVKVSSQASESGGDGSSSVKLTDYSWSVKQALQAEGSSGEVTYAIDENPVPSGYIKSVDMRFEGSTGITYFVVTNEQQHSEFGFTKVAYEDYGNTLKGAEFDLYYWDSRDEVSENLLNQSNPAPWKVLESVTTGEDGRVLFEKLPAGAYRLVETKAPDGRSLPDAQWTIQVSFTEDTAQGSLVPAVTRTRIPGKPSEEDVDFDYAVVTEETREDENGDPITVTDVTKADEKVTGAYLVLPNKVTVPTPTGVSVYDRYVIWLLLLTAAFGVCVIWERKRRAQDGAGRR